MGTISFLIVLSILVFFHELGHFSVARYFGVKVYTFSIGFGPKLISKYMFGTTWSLSLIPLGGYVKMKGQEDLDPTKVSNDKDSYNVLSPIKRILILLAGPFANFLLAFVLYFAVGFMDHKELSATIGNVVINSPAYKAGLQKNDTIIQIDNKKVIKWDDLSTIIKQSTHPMKFLIKRHNRFRVLIINAKLTNTQNIFKEQIKRKMVGISPSGKIITISYSFFDSIDYAYDKTLQASKMIFQGLTKLLQGVVPSSEVGGVISIGKVIADASQSGILALFIVGALISVNLGVLNLLPIPALDGGHIMFNLYELITKRKPSNKVLIQLTIMGWILLIGLMLLGIYNDINRFF